MFQRVPIVFFRRRPLLPIVVCRGAYFRSKGGRAIRFRESPSRHTPGVSFRAEVRAGFVFPQFPAGRRIRPRQSNVVAARLTYRHHQGFFFRAVRRLVEGRKDRPLLFCALIHRTVPFVHATIKDGRRQGPFMGRSPVHFRRGLRNGVQRLVV